jgi:predicted small lipoprotein YifL
MSRLRHFRLSILVSMLMFAILGGVVGCGSKGDLVRPAADTSAKG